MPTAQHFALWLHYDGSAYSGFSASGGASSIHAALQAALGRIHEADASLDAASRTDAGVHALCQLIHLHTTRPWHAHDLAAAVAHQLPNDIALHALQAVPADWMCSACSSKTYAYILDRGSHPDPFRRHHSWHVPGELDQEQIAQAAAACVGTHDWSAFRRRDEQRSDLTRTLHSLSWHDDHLLLCGNGFIHHQVRSLVGMLLAVGKGSISLAQVHAALSGQVNPASQQQAPARGLWLLAVAHPAWPFAHTAAATPPTWLRSRAG